MSRPANFDVVALGADLALEVGLDVGEEQHVGGLRLLGELRLEVTEHVQLGVVGVGRVQVELVVALPEEGLGAGDPLDVIGDHAAVLEHVDLGLGEVVTDRADHADIGEEAGSERKMDGGAAEHLLALAERRMDGIEGDRADNGQRQGEPFRFR